MPSPGPGPPCVTGMVGVCLITQMWGHGHSWPILGTGHEAFLLTTPHTINLAPPFNASGGSRGCGSICASASSGLPRKLSSDSPCTRGTCLWGPRMDAEDTVPTGDKAPPAWAEAAGRDPQVRAGCCMSGAGEFLIDCVCSTGRGGQVSASSRTQAPA